MSRTKTIGEGLGDEIRREDVNIIGADELKFVRVVGRDQVGGENINNICANLRDPIGVELSYNRFTCI